MTVSIEEPCGCAGRGRQVIAVCKSADLLLMVLDASRPHAHRRILTEELESVGIRLNRYLFFSQDDAVNAPNFFCDCIWV